MIKANELRLGNWVKPTSPRHGEKHLEIESISNDSVNLEFREYRISELRPIPLTPEILEKCEFVWKGGARYGDRLEETYSNGKIGITRTDKILFTYSHFDTPIQYIHQLQNLYFALTGEELTVNF